MLESDKPQQRTTASPSLGIRSGLHRTAAKDYEPEETATGRRWIRWMHKCGIKQWIVPGIIAASTLVKVAIGLGSYSGVHCWIINIGFVVALLRKFMIISFTYRSKYATYVWRL